MRKEGMHASLVLRILEIILRLSALLGDYVVGSDYHDAEGISYSETQQGIVACVEDPRQDHNHDSDASEHLAISWT